MGDSLIAQHTRTPRPAATVVVAVLCLLLAACATQAPVQPAATGSYPIADGIEATIVGTPPAWRAPLPDDIPIEMRALAPLVSRDVPTVLEYAVPLQYALAAQPQAAPLVFVIAGTGATAGSAKCRTLLRMLYAVGDSAVCLPSPTSVNFMVGAERNPVPGYMPADVQALYAMMQAIRHDVADELEVTDYALAGYSLGATQAAFVARYDEHRRDFGFTKTLLINPAVSVWASVQRMDALVRNNLPGGIDGVPAFLASLLADMRQPYAGTGDRPPRFNRQMLFRATLAHETSHRQQAAVVGLVFRLALANMAFAADVLTSSGVIVPADVRLGIGDSLEPYLRASFEMTFADYINQLLLPYWNQGQRQLSRRQLIDSASLRSIGQWLAGNPRVAVLTNADDPILDAAALRFLRQTFASRAFIQPDGGHLGNLQSRAVVKRVQQFFAP